MVEFHDLFARHGITVAGVLRRTEPSPIPITTPDVAAHLGSSN